jgi:hypothetical protein
MIVSDLPRDPRLSREYNRPFIAAGAAIRTGTRGDGSDVHDMDDADRDISEGKMALLATRR